MRRTVALTATLTLMASLGSAWAGQPDSRGLDFFERKIRPVLVEQCYACHSATAAAKNKLRGGLRLDTKVGLLTGGESGPALVPGKANESLVIEVLRYDDAVQMPPRGKLPNSVIADFESWINMGAPDPRTAATPSARPAQIDLERGRRHWAYQMPRRTPSPKLRDTSWPRDEIDGFVLARLEARGLHPGTDASRPVLARRLYFDLLGLPPSPEEIDAFVNDPSPMAYERLVDRLLASPLFGERWGRHWLDVARFAESLTLRGLILKEAWRYRDDVIRSFNSDLPFDQFIREQIAGDLLSAASLADRRRQCTAIAFLTLGNSNLEEQDKGQLRMDVVDEQLDTIGKAILAQTIGCARCHDHKFDPIPTRDYYALAGILRNTRTLEHANVSRWLERPLPVEPREEERFRRHEQAQAAIAARIKEERARIGSSGSMARKGAIAVAELPGVVVDDARAVKVGDWQDSRYSGTFIGAGYIHDKDSGKGLKSLTFQPELPRAGDYEVWLAYPPGGNRARAVPVTVLSASGEKTVQVDMRAAPPVQGRFVSLGQYHFESKNQGYVLVSNEGTQGHVVADAVVFLPVEQAGRLAAPPSAADAKQARHLAALEAEMRRLRAAAPEREMILSVFEEKEIGDTQVHIRGSVHSLGVDAPRGFLQVATYGDRPTFSKSQSGRRELADWLSSRENPLTARVFVNRAWHWLFGAGLVRTTDNFGTTGEAPSHPELLDHLALQFMDDGWSVKRLVRSIVLSHTYRQAAESDARTTSIDPENRLLAHANRRRLDAECIRDAILLTSGRLRLEMYGPSFPRTLEADYGFKSADPRRSVYAPVFRNALPELFEVFDFADPSMVTGTRNVSTVAPQALFLMNHPLMLEQSRAAANRLLAEAHADDPARVDRAYRLVLGRPPSEKERRIALDFVAKTADARECWAALFHALFASVDFRYVN